ncbi:MAG: helix-turn-helix transcriptional regulator [Verrucomicrobia bacterium]|jgi:AraC-like DNA-binding protein|nr:helix-turn-helix transcriptional regulator [Verrucomicrobiota bacterium]MBT7065041.1 helix-turn-helix transcriptional regulator [Verrucomicrobiota bacterium]MBT7701633.1 helix-turn-helix transcriptional regulator [Verrucomicrobiota bacterium]
MDITYRSPDALAPVQALTWRLLAGQSAAYGAAWGNFGRELIRNDFARLYLLESGHISIQTAADTFQLTPGHLWLIPGGIAARYCCATTMHLNWVHFNVFAIPELDLLAGGAPRAMPADAASVSRFHAMLEAATTSQPMALATALAILGGLVAPFFPAEWGDLLPDARALHRLRPALDHITSRFATDCSVGALARAVHLHPVYFSRLFKATLGIPPAQYVTAIRMRHAATRLGTTPLPVKAIAIECGYPDPYHFSRAFKRHTGVAPQVYRHAHTR